jgi:hypothetical protein
MKLITFLLFSLFAKLVMAQATLTFAGIEWNIRSGTGGPGPNHWSNSTNSVWVDTVGRLHLKIRKAGDLWYCAEIYTKQSFGYGEYRFYVASNVENFDPNTVVGLFTYETDTREIDIEFSRWGYPSNVDGWYTIQPPPYNSSNQKSFSLDLTSNNSTHKFIWGSSSIFFQSYQGHSDTLPSLNSLIKQWNYTGSNNPPIGNERLHINYWLFSGNPPINQQEAELIIQAVYVPLGALQVTLSPDEAIAAGAQWAIDQGKWQPSGKTLPNLAVGQHTVNFKSITGWISPPATTITLNANQTFYGNYLYSPLDGIESYQNADYKIYPVPTNQYLTIESTLNGIIGRITIFNALGQVTYSDAINESLWKVNVSEYKSGIYLIRMDFLNKTCVDRFCIIR